jgi:hypothetical protein
MMLANERLQSALSGSETICLFLSRDEAIRETIETAVVVRVPTK